MQTSEGALISIHTDYLIVGAGAVGLTVADVLLTETDATITIVDRDHSPGGHWNRAYPFVRLHQPGLHYGVMSRPLGGNLVETAGPNAGMATLSTGAEIRANFQKVMDEVLLASGRVTYLPMSEVQADGTVRSLLSGDTQKITVNRKIIEAQHGGGTIPAMQKPAFDVDDGAPFIPVGGLGDITVPASQYVILGSGKTGIDACLWLLQNGVAPDRIVWVMPRDAWLLDRRAAQPGAGFYELKLRLAVSENRALIDATTPNDLFDRLESTGNLLRFDPAVRPTAYKCATVTPQELAELRQITNIVRQGHVRRVGLERVELAEGQIDLPKGAICVDCTASAIPQPIAPPIFRPDRIVMNAVRTCQPSFSAALLGHLEATYSDDAEKNRLARVVPLPRDDADWLRMNFVNRQNQYAWLQEPDLRTWLKTCRLDALTNIEKPASLSAETQATGAEVKATMFPSTIRLKQLLDQVEAA